jgi:hypothetical protein
MTFVEPRRITFRIRLGSTQVMLIQAIAHLDAAQLPFLGTNPTSEERIRMVKWIEQEFFPVDCNDPDPGRVTLRRLNRSEYNRTIRDLVGN